jgi:hypothetical protein
MITIFCDFRQFSAKKLAFFSKINVMIQILHNLALFWVKNANFFCWIFWRKYFKNHNIGPRLGEISPIRRLLTLGSFFENHKSSPHFWSFFSVVNVVYQFWQNTGWATFWAIFPTNLSGHPGIFSPYFFFRAKALGPNHSNSIKSEFVRLVITFCSTSNDDKPNVTKSIEISIFFFKNALNCTYRYCTICNAF